MAERVRIQKAIARAGLMSRRAAEEAMVEGRVRLNGEAVVLGDRVDPDHDILTVDGQFGVPGQAKCGVQDGAVLRRVDPLACEHRVTARRHAGAPGPLEQMGDHGVGDGLLGEVDSQIAGHDDVARRAVGVGVEQFAKGGGRIAHATEASPSLFPRLVTASPMIALGLVAALV